MRRLSLFAVCVLVVFAGCTGGGGGAATDATTAATPTADEAGGGSSDAGSGSGSAGSDAPADVALLLESGEHYEYDVRSAILADAPETGTLSVDVTSGGEWPEVGMKVVRDAPSGRIESSSEEAAAFSPALAEMSTALTVRMLVVNSRLVAGKRTDVRTYDPGETWTFESSNGKLNFEVVGEESVAGMAAKHVRLTGESESDLHADIWLVPGVGFPAKYVQTEDGDPAIELTLTSYEGA